MKNTQYFAILTVAALMGACSNTNTPPAADTAAAPAAPAVSEAEKNYQEGKRLVEANVSGQDLANAVNMLLKSSELGNADAKVLLAKLYRDGQGLTKNPVEAVNLLLAAAQDGSANAAYELGLFYETGVGTEKNPGEALNNYLKAAQGGNADAMFKVGEAFRTGAGASVNLQEASNWYRKAADAGNQDAATKVKELEAK